MDTSIDETIGDVAEILGADRDKLRWSNGVQKRTIKRINKLIEIAEKMVDEDDEHKFYQLFLEICSKNLRYSHPITKRLRKAYAKTEYSYLTEFFFS